MRRKDCPHGNLANDGVHSYQYDGEGNLLTVDTGQTASYIFSALNRREEVRSGSGPVQEIAYNIDGRRVSVWDGATGNMVQAQTYWGPLPVAYYQEGQIHFQHQDWLGSERITTSYTAAIETASANLAFGDGFGASGRDIDAYHFAQLDHDYDGANEHARFREYLPMQGRWMSPDPYAGSYDPTNPQSFNRYSYVLNNPLSFNDPTGLTCSVVVGGITQSPNTSQTSAQQQFASSIGAIQAFPYAGGNIPSGVLSVEAQALYANTNATWVTAAALTQAAANGSFNIFTFSGGLQATISALRLVSPQVRSLVQNITSISPGVGLGGGAEGPVSANQTVLTGNTGTDKVAQGGFVVGGISSGCGHDANCAFSHNSALLAKQAGSGPGCSTPTIYVPRGAGGGQQVSSPWSYPSLLFFGWFGGDGTSVTTTQTIVLPQQK